MLDSDVLTLLGHLAGQSLMAIGGIYVVLGELHRVVVVSHGWLTPADFTGLFALAQAAPGPNMMFVTLIGWRMGGVPGAVAATLAFVGPASILAMMVAQLWTTWGEKRWFVLLRRGLVPMTVGLMVASAWLLTSAASIGWGGHVVTAGAAALALRTRLHPVAILAIAAALGAAGLA